MPAQANSEPRILRPPRWRPTVRALCLIAAGMLAFGAAELPALASMSAHGTSVLGFELAGSTSRLRTILTRWGDPGRSAAERHVLLDLGFIVGYGLLLAGICTRLAGSLRARGRDRLATVAALLAWAALLAAIANLVQKLLLWLELHGHTAQPLPAIAMACDIVTFGLALPAALFAATVAIMQGRASRHVSEP
ncbi:MAG TPA: hypothetical protein VGF95_08390 [Solirubrobacteraceae bacterium]